VRASKANAGEEAAHEAVLAEERRKAKRDRYEVHLEHVELESRIRSSERDAYVKIARSMDLRSVLELLPASGSARRLSQQPLANHQELLVLHKNVVGTDDQD
jgi:hypothetical protein